MKIQTLGLILLTLATASVADEVSTEVSWATKYTQLWRNDQPPRLFECWGRYDEIALYEDTRKGDSKEKSGTAAQQIDPRGKPFKSFAPQIVNWNSELTSNRVFKVSFSQQVNPTYLAYDHGACNTEKYYAKVDVIANKFSSHASIWIPADIYLVKITRTAFSKQETTVHDLNSHVVNASRAIRDGIENAVNLRVGEVDYFIVNPGERMDFGVEWESQAIETASFNVEYKIEMVGADMCEENLWDPTTDSGAAAKIVVARRFSAEKFTTHPEQVISGLACLRSAPYMQAILVENHGHDLVVLLETLADQLKAYLREPKTLNSFSREVTLVTQMSVYDIARTLLKDLSAFCDPREILGFLPNQPLRPVKVPGYMYAGRMYFKISLAFEQAPIALLETFSRTLDALSKERRTYADVMNDRAAVALRELNFLVTRPQFYTFELVEDYLQQVPRMKWNSRLPSLLSDGQQSFQRLDTEFRKQVYALSRRDSSTIDAGALTAAIEDYKRRLLLTREAMAADIDWLRLDEDGYLAKTPFARDLTKLNYDLVKVTGDLLEVSYSSKLGAKSRNNFVKKSEMDAEVQAIQQCLEGGK